MVERSRAASEIPIGAMVDLFNRGYAGYYVPITLGEAAFTDMVATQDIDLESSCVIEDGETPVAFALLGVRERRGWIGGMGVAPEARGRGLGRVAMQGAIDAARARRLVHVDLEVLVQNEPAARIYEALGFRDVRELGVWARDAAPPSPAAAADDGVVSLDVADRVARYETMRRTRPSWQRERPVVERSVQMLSALGVWEGGAVLGSILYRPVEKQVRILDVAYADGAPADVVDRLLAALSRAHPDASMMYLNLPPDAPEARAFERAGFGPKFRQREMRLEL